MADTPTTRVWLGRSIFVLVTLALIFVQLLPLSMIPAVWAAPDWGLAVALVWVARRPDYAPMIVLAGLFFLADLLFQRPPGLWSALVVILSEILRTRAKGIRNMPFALEWGTVSVGIIVITLLNRAVLTVVMTAQAPLGLTLIQMMMTIIFYPLVVAVAHFVFGVSRPSLGQVDSRGHRL
tara:strand:+ start:453 stop:992 length:540 start_codon:yes stop_codon:yes gene_type:complete